MPPPPSREPTPPPPREPTPAQEKAPTPPCRPSRPSRPCTTPRHEPKSGRQTLTSLLAGVSNPKKRKQIIKEYARVHNLPSEMETDSEFEKKKKPRRGKLNIEQFVIKRKKKKIRSFKCPVCRKMDKTQHEQNLHIQHKHPTFRFTCQYCKKTYQTFNAKWKHEKTHGQFRHKCNICKVRFQFPKGLKEHMVGHTGKNKYPCTNCRQSYNSFRAMKTHAKMHMNILHKCDVCTRTFKDPAYLRQHRRGAHGRGWTALCGHVVDWPPKLHRHQRMCATCKGIKEKQRKAKMQLQRRIKKKQHKNQHRTKK